MSDQPKPTGGEWMFRLVEYFTAMDTVNFRQLCSQLSEEINAALDAEREKVKEAEAQDWRHMEKAHHEVMLDRKQLAAEREKYQRSQEKVREYFDLLAAEREKVQTLVDALNYCRTGVNVSVIDYALAKVKEGK